MVDWMHKEITASETIEFKKLESHRRFSVCLTRTYPS